MYKTNVLTIIQRVHISSPRPFLLGQISEGPLCIRLAHNHKYRIKFVLLTISSSPCLFFLTADGSPSRNTRVPCFPLGRLCVTLRKRLESFAKLNYLLNLLCDLATFQQHMPFCYEAVILSHVRNGVSNVLVYVRLRLNTSSRRAISGKCS